MQLRPLFPASAAATVVSAACRGSKKPELAEPASSFCFIYKQPTITNSATVIATTVMQITMAAPVETVAVTSRSPSRSP
ncbi:hypothetical protein VTI74DRAFT_2103 [Chaetomium olivicolor]